MTIEDPRKQYYRIFMGIIIVGSVAGYVFGSRYMRDMNTISKQITHRVYPTKPTSMTALKSTTPMIINQKKNIPNSGSGTENTDKHNE